MTEIGEVGVRQRSRQEIKRLVRKFETSGLNRVTTVDRVTSVRSEVHSSEIWSETVRSNGSSLKDVGGSYSWVLVREGDSWKIRNAAYTEQT
jgi:hypothetical protein